MKKVKSILALLLAAAMLFGCAGTSAIAEEKTYDGEFEALCYNVAGLPDISAFTGGEGRNVPKNQRTIGEMVNISNYSIVAVQEDFGFHASLVAPMRNYPYKTVHSGGIPGGDGLNIFSKNPIYNAQRITWDSLYGVINWGADELTPKGILYAVVDIGGGVLVDFYNLHCDAYGDEGSKAARRDNLKQLSEIITARGTDRPVIATGDFNISSHFADDNGFNEYLIYGAGMKDAWTELYNDGDYEDYSRHFNPENPDWSDCWGRWDSVEHFIYRDGGGVHLQASDFHYIDYKNSDGKSCSDHSSAAVKFVYTLGSDYKPSEEKLSVTRFNLFKFIYNKIYYIVVDLYKIIVHFDELKSAIS